MKPKGVVAASMPQWISVEDRLPTEDGEYLVCDTHDEAYYVYSSHFDKNMGENGEFGTWHEFHDPDTLGFLNAEFENDPSITHWMPLPPPPKEVSE